MVLVQGGGVLLNPSKTERDRDFNNNSERVAAVIMIWKLSLCVYTEQQLLRYSAIMCERARALLYTVNNFIRAVSVLFCARS